MNAHVATAIESNGAGRVKQAVGSSLEVLFDGVDDLIRRVADTENPEIRKIRAKVHAALVAAKNEFEETAKQVPGRWHGSHIARLLREPASGMTSKRPVCVWSGATGQ